MGSGVLSYHPTELKDASEFIKGLRSRREITAILKWSTHFHVPPSSMAVFLTVKHHSFTIKMINVREYRKRWERKHKTKWKYINSKLRTR